MQLTSPMFLSVEGSRRALAGPTKTAPVASTGAAGWLPISTRRRAGFPVIVGAGRRLFPENGVATSLRLDESRTTPSGVTISVYRPTGRAEFGEVGT